MCYVSELVYWVHGQTICIWSVFSTVVWYSSFAFIIKPGYWMHNILAFLKKHLKFRVKMSSIFHLPFFCISSISFLVLWWISDEKMHHKDVSNIKIETGVESFHHQCINLIRITCNFEMLSKHMTDFPSRSTNSYNILHFIESSVSGTFTLYLSFNIYCILTSSSLKTELLLFLIC